jgi:FixJ family two-component response regulator
LYFGTMYFRTMAEPPMPRQNANTGDVPRSGALWLLEKSIQTVIVVDDDASIRRALRRQLQILGFKVLIFRSAEEMLAGELPTGNVCLLLDIYMPGMSGIELYRSLAASGRSLPTVLMTGSDDHQTRQIIREAKPIAIVLKPFDEKTLLRAIRKAFPSQSTSQSN